jgi:Tfp pilus assembly protein PilF
MSLLMDALKKAEEARLLVGETHPPDAGPELTLAPMNPEAPPAPPRPAPSSLSASAERSAVTDDMMPKRSQPATAPGSPNASQRQGAERAAARNVFSAKAPPRSRRGLWPVLAVFATAALGLGAYFGWQLQSISGGAQPLQTTFQAPVTAPAPAPTPPLAPALPAATQAATPPPDVRPAQQSSAARTTSKPAELPAPRLPVATPAARRMPADSTVRLSRSQPSPTIEHAYDALQAGRLDEAQGDYERVLRSDPKNTDALLGLATIAARHGQAELAQGYYLRALESDPNDATAQAGLLNTRGQADPGLSESRLKSALVSQPESPALHFALGNLYSRQGRWSEAQQAYFRAYSGEPDNADFIFNLAVSLDHLRQNRLAAQYYEMALGAAADHGSLFDKEQARQRITELRP